MLLANRKILNDYIYNKYPLLNIFAIWQPCPHAKILRGLKHIFVKISFAKVVTIFFFWIQSKNRNI